MNILKLTMHKLPSPFGEGLGDGVFCFAQSSQRSKDAKSQERSFFYKTKKLISGKYFQPLNPRSVLNFTKHEVFYKTKLLIIGKYFQPLNPRNKLNR